VVFYFAPFRSGARIGHDIYIYVYIYVLYVYIYLHIQYMCYIYKFIVLCHVIPRTPRTRHAAPPRRRGAANTPCAKQKQKNERQQPGQFRVGPASRLILFCMCLNVFGLNVHIYYIYYYLLLNVFKYSYRYDYYYYFMITIAITIAIHIYTIFHYLARYII